MNPQMQQYRQYPPAQNRSPAARRPGQMPASAQQYAAQQAQLQNQQAQQRHAVLEHQLAQRRARKPTDRNMPEGIEDLTIGEGVQQFKDLREQERRLDYAMMRKKLDMQDVFSKNNRRQKTLRLWISNTAENQPWQANGLDDNAFDFQATSDGTFRVKIEGRLLEDPEDDVLESDDEGEEDGEEESKPTEETPKSSQKMSHFFKSMNIEFDKSRNSAPDPGFQVEWKKQPNTADVDVIEFARRGDENMNINVILVRDEQPERYRLSQALSSTLDMEEADRQEVVLALWEYVRCMNLQEDDEKRAIRCDERLRHIFGRDHIYFPQVPELIMQHLHPLPPIRLQYTIRVDQEYVSNPEPTVYDIRVLVDDPLRAKVIAMTQNPELIASLRQITHLDDQLAVIIQAIQHSKAKHAFYKAMSKDPVNFVRRWMNSQRRDLEVILGEAARGGGEDGSGPEFARGGKDGVWGSELTREAVRYMLAKPQAQKV